MAIYKIVKRADGLYDIQGMLKSGREVTAEASVKGVMASQIFAEGTKLAEKLNVTRVSLRAARAGGSLPGRTG